MFLSYLWWANGANGGRCEVFKFWPTIIEDFPIAIGAERSWRRSLADHMLHELSCLDQGIRSGVSLKLASSLGGESDLWLLVDLMAVSLEATSG